MRLTRKLGPQAVRQVEQQLVLESLVKFMNIIDGLTTDQAALDATKTWSLHDLEAFFQARQTLQHPVQLATANHMLVSICSACLLVQDHACGKSKLQLLCCKLVSRCIRVQLCRRRIKVGSL